MAGENEDVKQAEDASSAASSGANSIDKELENLSPEQLESLATKLESQIKDAKAGETQDTSTDDVKSEKTKAENAIPYARFKEVNDEVKELRAQLAQVK